MNTNSFKNWAAGLCAFVASCLLASPSNADELSGTVVNISDGDTITLLDAEKHTHKVRLAAIDAPEKTQPFSDAAKQRLTELVGNRPVVVKTETRDRYGREIGRVFVLVEVNELLVREGLAFHYVHYNPDDTVIAAAETFARKNKLGVWTLPNGGQRPWDFRRSGKKKFSRNAKESPDLPAKASEANKPPEALTAEKSDAAKQLFWVTLSSGKVHNTSCKNFKNTKGYLTDNPSGPDCKICGGAKPDGE